MLKKVLKKSIGKFGVGFVLAGLMMVNGANLVMAEGASAMAGLSRGEATDLAVKFLDLEKKNADYLKGCRVDPGTCLFAFSSRTNFSIMLKPVILYPDVYPAYRYYKSINIASELDLVRGYFEEENSPYRPEQPITKVEALKLVLGATNVVNWKEKFEIAASGIAKSESNNWLMFGLNSDKWWYGRYLAAAESNGFWQGVSASEADAGISKQDFLKLLDNANKIVANRQASSLADNNGQGDQKANTSGNLAL